MNLEDTTSFSVVLLKKGGGVLRDPPVLWQSGDPSMVVIDPASGWAQSRKPGHLVIRATYGSLRAEADLTVLPEVAFSSLSAGYDHTCGVSVTGRLFCWGGNARRQLGLSQDLLGTGPPFCPGWLYCLVLFRVNRGYLYGAVSAGK